MEVEGAVIQTRLQDTMKEATGGIRDIIAEVVLELRIVQSEGLHDGRVVPSRVGGSPPVDIDVEASVRSFQAHRGQRPCAEVGGEMR